METTNVAYAPKVLAGIDVVDQAWGGMYRGGSYVVYGRAGCGRGLLTLLFTHTGVLLEEPCLFVSLARPKDLMIQASSIGFDLRGAHEHRLVRLMRVPPMLNLDSDNDEAVTRALQELVAIIRQDRPTRLVIDEFMPFVQFRSFDRFRAAFIDMLEQIDWLDTTMILGMPEPANAQSRRIIDFMSAQMTGAIHIEMAEDASSTRRRVTLLPNIGHIRRKVIEYWDLAEVVEPTEHIIDASMRMLPRADQNPYATPAVRRPEEVLRPAPPAPRTDPTERPRATRPETHRPEPAVPELTDREWMPRDAATATPPPVEPAHVDPLPEPLMAPSAAPARSGAIPLGRRARAEQSWHAEAAASAVQPDPTAAAPEPRPHIQEPPSPAIEPALPEYDEPAPPARYVAQERFAAVRPGPNAPARHAERGRAVDFEPVHLASVAAPAPVLEETVVQNPSSPDREEFGVQLQQQFLRRDLNNTPFLLIALRMDRSSGRSPRPFDFEFILDLTSASVRPEDRLLVDLAQERLIALLPDSRPEEAQVFFNKLKERLKQEAPQQADHLLHSVSAIVVPDGRPFNSAEEFLAYALDES
jgi:KaiC/GvpD/RAD55 family RecA-like ATPase